MLPPPKPLRATDVAAALRSDDLKTHVLPLPRGRLNIVYLGSLVDKKRLWSQFEEPLVTKGALFDLPGSKRLDTLDKVLKHLLLGWAVALSGAGVPVGLPLMGLQQRQVAEPTTEKEVIGPKEALVEDLETSIGLVRNRLRDSALRVSIFVVGRRSQTQVALVHLEGVASREIVAKAASGLRSLDVDFVRNAGEVAELLYGRSLTVFPLVEQTERSDRIADGLALGRVGLIVEGSPFALLVPATFMEFLKDQESALPGPAISLYVRTLRLGGLVLSAAMPGIYVAVLSSDPQILPLPLALTLTTVRFGVPYPVATEAIIMLLLVDILAEATSQAAGSVGNTLAIVGTLIIGQMMVQAHLASSLLMIVVSASVLGTYLTIKFPFSYGLRIWKYLLVVLAAVAGVGGWFTGFLLLLVHLASLKSAGVPYLSPLGPMRPYDLAHYALVQPTRGNETLRPRMFRPEQRVRQGRRGRKR